MPETMILRDVKKKIEHELIYTKDPPPIPHHHFNITRGIFICNRCGYVLGGGKGIKPDCYEAGEEKEQNKERYMAEYEKVSQDS